MNKKIIALVSVIIVITAVICGFAFRAAGMRIDKPVFLTHYYDLPSFSDGRVFQLKYITNRNDSRSVTKVTFPEYPDINIYLNSASIENVYRYHKTGMIFMESKLTEGELDEPVEITKVRVGFSDETEDDFDIGRIILDTAPASSGLLRDLGGGVSNQGDSSDTMLVMSDCVLTDIKSNFNSDIGAEVDIKINGGDCALPRELAKDGTLAFSSILRINNGSEFNMYDLNQTLLLESGGETYRDYLINIRHTPSFTESGIIECLRRRGEI